MSEVRTISAQLRDRVGKGSARAARRAGLVPAVIYGGKRK
ncbi:MAG: 50S ribosomal protein L25, partial [Sphingomonadales bacterium]